MKEKNIYKVEHKNISWTNFHELCKGCGLCIVRCPKKCLKFSKKDVGFLGTPAIECEIEKCIACKVCELNCPDIAIKVDKD